jgi:hypothetical protein
MISLETTRTEPLTPAYCMTSAHSP